MAQCGLVQAGGSTEAASPGMMGGSSSTSLQKTVSGVSRYDGKEFVNIDQLADNWVGTIRRDLDGTMWFGTGWSRSKGSGVFRYDGKEFVNLTTADGLANNVVVDIYCDQDGVVWFATGGGGVSRHDGRKFANLTTEDGLLSNRICNIYRDTDGLLWFASLGGVSRYDGKQFTNFTKEDGLASNDLNVTCDGSICQDTDGVLWFATDGGGVSGYDGTAWTSLDTRDGLLDNRMGPILQDPDGYLWFASQGGGVTRYRKSTTAPKAHIVSVTTDQTYRDLSAIPAFTPGTRVTIEYNSIDLKTLLEKRQYRVRIREIDSDWRKPTRDTSLDFIFHEPGIYTFGVQAIDQDLNYSEPASVELIVQPDPALVSMKTELSYLRREVRSKYHFENIIGRSTGVREVRALMERAIDSGLTVLITGETGTGKELVAKAIHHNSPRRDQPILALNCGAVPKELITSSLFGHRKGAFTSAHEDQVGLFEAASGGTLLLDEIAEMPRDAQIQLLRVLEERVVQRIGEHTSREVDVRIMAMTNRDLMNEVTKGQFREDLYYRLSVFPIHIPPLRERVEDIPTLAEHFLHEYSQEQKKDLDSFAPDVIQMLQSYSWPGNVRELRNVIQRAAALAQEGDRIQTNCLPPQITRGEPVIQEILSEQMNLSTAVDHVQRRLVENALRESNGNRAQAARMLGLHRSNLVRLMKRLGIE
jgi:two-component system response regulator AtoC